MFYSIHGEKSYICFENYSKVLISYHAAYMHA